MVKSIIIIKYTNKQIHCFKNLGTKDNNIKYDYFRPDHSDHILIIEIIIEISTDNSICLDLVTKRSRS